MTFTDAISRCFANYVGFSGRARRPEYWWFVLFFVLGALVFGLLDGMLFSPNPQTGEPPSYLQSIWALALYLPLLAAAWRRMHDTGRPGWYMLLPMLLSLLTFVGLMAGVIGFSSLALNSADPEQLRAPAALIGGTGLVVVFVLQTILFLLLLYWLTRPSQRGANQYGPEPAL